MCALPPAPGREELDYWSVDGGVLVDVGEAGFWGRRPSDRGGGGPQGSHPRAGVRCWCDSACTWYASARSKRTRPRRSVRQHRAGASLMGSCEPPSIPLDRRTGVRAKYSPCELPGGPELCDRVSTPRRSPSRVSGARWRRWSAATPAGERRSALGPHWVRPQRRSRSSHVGRGRGT